MPEFLDEVQHFFNDLHALLWVCQRFDLTAGEDPHTYDIPFAEALLRYRESPNELDNALASIYWEAVWLEGGMSPVYTAMKAKADNEEPASRRQVYPLSGEADVEANISSIIFLPTFILAGRMDKEASEASKYGVLPPRRRKKLAEDLAVRIEKYPRRLLVVVGAQEPSDLEEVLDAVEIARLTDLAVLIVWPPGAEEPELPEVPAVDYHIWVGSTEDFVRAASQAGVPSSDSRPKWGLRIGKDTPIEITSRDLHRIQRRFALIYEKDFTPVETFMLDDLHAFLGGDLENWKAYSVGLPVERSYRCDGKRFEEIVLEKLKELAERDRASATVLRLPGRPGTGVTTMLRSAAFAAAKAGFPVMILKPEQIRLDFDEIEVFTKALSEKAEDTRTKEMPPILIVLDVDHVALNLGQQLPQFLNTHRRRALVLEGIEHHESDTSRAKPKSLLQPLDTAVTDEEVVKCHDAFQSIRDNWNVEIETPDINEWRRYQKTHGYWTIPGSRQASEVLFWVALRFFLTEGLGELDADRAGRTLGQWVEKRLEDIKDGNSLALLDFVASLAAFRLGSPLQTVIRPITGGVYTSGFGETFRKVDCLISWAGTSDDTGEEMLSFRHHALALQYLDLREIRSNEEIFQTLRPLIKSLSVGSTADWWLSSELAAHVFVEGKEKEIDDWDWRLEGFKTIPVGIAERNSTVLHHWARALFNSVANDAYRMRSKLTDDQCLARIEEAIDLLHKAIALPRDERNREKLSHLYNTIGTAYLRHEEITRRLGRVEVARRDWAAANRAFEESIVESKGTNVEAYLALTRRLLKNLQAPGRASIEDSAEMLAAATEILSLLDQAEDVADGMVPRPYDYIEDIAKYRGRALSFVKDFPSDITGQLKASGDPELGYLCEAWKVFSENPRSEATTNAALSVFDQASSEGVRFGPNGILFWLRLLRTNDTAKYDYDLQYRLYKDLSAFEGYTARPVELFRRAVVCYQTKRFDEGERLFKRLREEVRLEGNIGYGMHDFLRDFDAPTRVLTTNVRIDRITNEWRAWGYVEAIRQDIPLRPRHFGPEAIKNAVIPCAVQFDQYGPLAVPPRSST